MLALGMIWVLLIQNTFTHEGELKLPKLFQTLEIGQLNGSKCKKEQFQASCDVYFYESAVEMGIERMSTFLKNSMKRETKNRFGLRKRWRGSKQRVEENQFLNQNKTKTGIWVRQ